MEEHSALEAEIRRRIALGGPMPISEFMALCLLDPTHGYYTTHDPLRRARRFHHSAGDKPDVRRTGRHLGIRRMEADGRP